MSEAQTAPPPTMPLFYKRVVGVNAAAHGSLRLDRTVGFAFAAHAQSVPIGLGEFEAACQFYPIVFTGGPNPVPVALLGLREGQNLFVGPDGRWRPDTYIPAYVRAYPFIFVEDSRTENVYIGMEPDAACLRAESGLAMFEEGKPSAALNEAIQFCTTVRDNLSAARVFASSLNEAKLLVDEEATITFHAGGTTKIRGFKMMQPDALNAVDDTSFLDWRANGWLTPIFAHRFSSGRWARLIELAAQDGSLKASGTNA